MLYKKQIYNPLSQESVNERKIFGGNPTAMFELTKIKYQWAYQLWKLMLNNTWFPEEISMAEDKKDYEHLSQHEHRAYDRALAQLIFMDSLQTNNLCDNINPFVTAPEINLILVRQAFEEALHSQSYAVMVEAISKNTEAIYNMWRLDTTLRNKNDYIANIYIDLANNPTEHNFIKALFANQILEGIYFYSGFTFFYALSKHGKMHGSAKMINFIHRDEVTHLQIFQQMIKSLQKERPDLFSQDLKDEVIEMFKEAVKVETAWGEYITGGDILGLSPASIKLHIEYLANDRLKAVGFAPLYDTKETPLKWVEDYAKFNKNKANFFESRVSNYSKGSINFDDI